MKIVNIIIGTLVSAVISTVIILVISLIKLMFTHDEVGYTTSFFNSLFVKAEENTDGWDLYTTLGVNTDNLTPIILTIIFFWFFYLILTKVYIDRKKKRENVK
ncbi:hypothetical protein ACFSKI_08360 [Pseudogracilibacillus auburnensis]|uniref:Uncharacterized protein n=1 Tax=Pseudogracilibacillus auburnensis TaxID=1494959 RepID=A0A2V3VV91_9BACI|nr:hypothetical protein [Pseudogracilibacillus auburnensis]PXW84781.1 hypothetical protein DFR56_11325 [Pseudogracilibacillus auburnensis]